MKEQVFRAVILSQTILAGLFSSAAYAQSTDTDQGVTVEEIVVTATRREQSLQAVPLAVSAFTTDTLAQSNVTGVQGLVALSPGVQIQAASTPGRAVLGIRGQIQTDVNPAVDPSVGLYFDDVYISRAAGQLMNLLDVSRVEILKGPQGTLFGKNTTGGAIRIISNLPTHDFGGYVSGGYETFDKWRVEGVLNVPISDTLAARVASQYSKKSGGYGINTVTGNPIDREKNFSIRGTLLWEPVDQLKVQITGDYSKINSGGIPTVMRHFEPGNGPFAVLEVGLEEGLGFAGGQTAIDRIAAVSGVRRDVGTDLRAITSTSYSFNPATGKFTYVGGDADPNGNIETWGALANITYDFGFATLKSITAIRRSSDIYSYDVDGTKYILVDGETSSDNKQFSQEFILNGSSFGDKLDWTLGGIYFDETANAVDKSISLAAVQAVFSGIRGPRNVQASKNSSAGAFAQATYSLTDKLSLTGGARYTVEKRNFDANSTTQRLDGSVVCNFTVANGIALRPEFVAPCTVSQRATFKEWSYHAAIDYQIDPDTLTYVSTSRSFRSGGFTPRITAPEALTSFRPEFVTSYEFGFKADLLDKRVRTALAVFTSKTTDVQLTQSGLSSTNQAYSVITNFGTKKISGVELEVVGKPATWLTLDGGLSYLHARSENAQVPDVTYVDQAPEWALKGGATVSAPLGEDFSLKLRGDVYYRSKLFISGGPLRNLSAVPIGNVAPGGILYTGIEPALTLLSGRVTLRQEKSGIELSLFGRNLTNRVYTNRAFTINGLGIDVGFVAEPRVVGFELKVPFGKL